MKISQTDIYVDEEEIEIHEKSVEGTPEELAEFHDALSESENPTSIEWDEEDEVLQIESSSGNW